MAKSFILTVFEDGIKQDHTDVIEKEVGISVLKLCLDPERVFLDSDGLERVKWEKIVNHGNCINFVKDVHSDDEIISKKIN
ncbi:hypothetical protein H8D83_01370 [Candidatus Woesearchaeota archaeon]|nr:hypothetical protein [Candidatus Woesearchaeota archaeon]